MVYIAVPTPSIVLSKKLNTMNNVGVGIMDKNLCVCVCMHVQQYGMCMYTKECVLECVFVGLGLTGGKVSRDIFKGHVGIAVSQYMHTAKIRWLTTDPCLPCCSYIHGC